MAHISNPPLDHGADVTRPAPLGHTSGSIVNPALDGSSSTPALTPDHDNPPLEPVTLEKASAADVLDNPRLDESTIESWFEAQLGSDTVPTVNPLVSEPATPEKAATKKQASKKKATTTRAAEKVSTKKAGKKAATKNVASTKRSARAGSDPGKRR